MGTLSILFRLTNSPRNAFCVFPFQDYFSEKPTSNPIYHIFRLLEKFFKIKLPLHGRYPERKSVEWGFDNSDTRSRCVVGTAIHSGNILLGINGLFYMKRKNCKESLKGVTLSAAWMTMSFLSDFKVQISLVFFSGLLKRGWTLPGDYGVRGAYSIVLRERI